MSSFDLGSFLSNNAGALAAMGIGGLLGSQNGAQQAGTTTTTSAPWTMQQPYLLDLFQKAQNSANSVPGVSSDMQGAFSGMQGALNNGLTSQAQGVISNTLGTNPADYYGIGMANPYQGQNVSTVTNPYLEQNNPYLNNAIQSASQQAMLGAMPAFDQAQAQSGSFGNSGVAQYFGNAMGNALGNIANQAEMGQYNTNLNATTNLGLGNAGIQEFNQGQNANLAQQQIQNSIGQYNQGQSVLNNAAFNAPQFNTGNMNNYGTLYNAATLNNNAQWNPLNNYSNLVRGTYGGTTSTPYYTNPVNGAMGGAALGSALYSGLFGG